MFCIFLGREFEEKKGFKIFVTKTHGNILGAVWLNIHSILLDLFFLLFLLLCTIDRIQEKKTSLEKHELVSSLLN